MRSPTANCRLVSFCSVLFSTRASKPLSLRRNAHSNGIGADCHQSLTNSSLVQTGTKISALKLSPLWRTVAFSEEGLAFQPPANSPLRVANFCWLDRVYRWFAGE